MLVGWRDFHMLCAGRATALRRVEPLELRWPSGCVTGARWQDWTEPTCAPAIQRSVPAPPGDIWLMKDTQSRSFSLNMRGFHKVPKPRVIDRVIEADKPHEKHQLSKRPDSM